MRGLQFLPSLKDEFHLLSESIVIPLRSLIAFATPGAILAHGAETAQTPCPTDGLYLLRCYWEPRPPTVEPVNLIRKGRDWGSSPRPGKSQWSIPSLRAQPR